MKAFHTWKANRIQFLAVWNGEGFHITDETGQNFGAWQDLERFRTLQAKRDPNGFLGIPGSWCRISMRATQENPTPEAGIPLKSRHKAQIKQGIKH